GPIGGSARAGLNTAPPLRSASAAGRPSASTSPSKTSPAECATMNHGGTPEAHSDPIIAPAEVPTMRSAVAGSQPVSCASAYIAPASHPPPITPPPPSTSPVRIARDRSPTALIGAQLLHAGRAWSLASGWAYDKPVPQHARAR